MKKIGILVLTLVVVMGALGIGYAAWTDQITVTGTVNTGSVNIDVVDTSGTWVYKVPGDVENNEIFIHHGWVTVPFETPEGAFEVASAFAMKTGDDTVDVTFTNAFPVAGGLTADILFKNTGTIPVIATAKLTGFTGDAELLAEVATVKFYFWTEAGGKGALIDGPVQLHGGEYVYAELTLVLPQSDQGGDVYQGLTGGFTATIDVIQWNESPVAPINPNVG